MKEIILNFQNVKYLQELLDDAKFIEDTNYLHPERIGNSKLKLIDPVVQHDLLGTELITLSILARNLKRIIFSDSDTNLEFLNPFGGERKNGLYYKHNSEIEIIIESTEFN